MEASTLGAKWRGSDDSESGNNGRFSWGQQAAHFPSTSAFKEAMVKDREVIALVGALMMTISWALLVTEPGSECPRWMHMATMLAQSIAAVLSSLATLGAVRTVLLVNTSSSEQTIALLSMVHEARWIKKAHSYNLLEWSIGSLVCASAGTIGCTHGLHNGELAAFILVFAAGGLWWLHEREIHGRARRQVGRDYSQLTTRRWTEAESGAAAAS